MNGLIYATPPKLNSIYTKTHKDILTLIEDIQLNFPNGWDRWTPGSLRELHADVKGSRFIKRERSPKAGGAP